VSKSEPPVAMEGLEPHMVMYKSMNVGKLFALQYYTDDPFILATAGDKGSVAVWECDEAETVKNYFQDKVIKEEDRTYTSLTNVTDPEAPKITKDSKGTEYEKDVDNKVNSITEALAQPGHQLSIVPIEVDDSWMDEVEPTAVIEKKKKSKKDKDKTKEKVKKDKVKPPAV
jgi:hypothetical protein